MWLAVGPGRGIEFQNASCRLGGGGGVKCGFGLTRGGSLGLSSGCLLF